jgi:hypothetical protein
MTPLRVGIVVEGHGEVEAAPILVRRVLEREDPASQVITPRPVRVGRNKVVKPHELERAVSLAYASTEGEGGVVVLIDADDDCPATLGPSLLLRARSAARGLFPVGVVVAAMECESWFISVAESIAGRRGLRPDIATPPNHATIRDAKRWLSEHMVNPKGRYSETLDQPALAAVMDLDNARDRSDSFDKFCRVLEEQSAHFRA